MLVVPDITDMFLPLNEGFLVDPMSSRGIIEGLLDSLPGLYAASSIVESAMTGPLKATMMALVNTPFSVAILSRRTLSLIHI